MAHDEAAAFTASFAGEVAPLAPRTRRHQVTRTRDPACAAISSAPWPASRSPAPTTPPPTRFRRACSRTTSARAASRSCLPRRSRCCCLVSGARSLLAGAVAVADPGAGRHLRPLGVAALGFVYVAAAPTSAIRSRSRSWSPAATLYYGERLRPAVLVMRSAAPCCCGSSSRSCSASRCRRASGGRLTEARPRLESARDELDHPGRVRRRALGHPRRRAARHLAVDRHGAAAAASPTAWIRSPRSSCSPRLRRRRVRRLDPRHPDPHARHQRRRGDGDRRLSRWSARDAPARRSASRSCPGSSAACSASPCWWSRPSRSRASRSRSRRPPISRSACWASRSSPASRAGRC